MRALNLCGLMAVVVLALLPSSKAPAQEPSAIEWRSDVDKALRHGKAVGKPVLLYFTADWCRPCHKLEATTLRDPGVIAELRRFVAIKVDATDATKVGSVLQEYDVEEFPTVVFIGPNGQVLPGARFYGYALPDVVLSRLKAIKGVRPKTE